MISLDKCFDRSKPELEKFLIFSICVAGKNAKSTDVAVERFLDPAFKLGLEPFEYLKYLVDRGTLKFRMVEAKLGKYSVLEKAFKYLAETALDLVFCQVNDLERVPGIGPKTARFFMLYTRGGVQFAVLDTHVLQHLRESGYRGAPKQTPQSPEVYRKWEKIVLSLAKEANVCPAEYDNVVWESRSSSALGG